MAMQSATIHTSQKRLRRRAYTLIEMLLVVLIIQLISAMVVFNVTGDCDQQQLGSAAQQIIGAVRYARALAMSTGQPCGVQFNTTGDTVTCYDTGTYTPAASGLFASGQYIINFPQTANSSGVTITAVQNAGSGPSTYNCLFGPLGNLADAPSDSLPVYVQLNCHGYTKTVTIPALGDPY